MKDQQKTQDAWKAAMDTPAVDAAAMALEQAMNDALSAQGLPPLKTFAILAHAGKHDTVFSTGCRCPGCLERMLSALAESFGARCSVVSAANPGRSKRGHH